MLKHHREMIVAIHKDFGALIAVALIGACPVVVAAETLTRLGFVVGIHARIPVAIGGPCRAGRTPLHRPARGLLCKVAGDRSRADIQAGFAEFVDAIPGTDIAPA